MLHGSPSGLQLNPFISRVHRLLWSVSDSLFAEIDSFAWTRDWSIERRLGRHVYRDRLFDALVECSLCRGVPAERAEKECRVCSGTGHLIRIDLPGGDG